MTEKHLSLAVTAVALSKKQWQGSTCNLLLISLEDWVLSAATAKASATDIHDDLTPATSSSLVVSNDYGRTN